AGAAAVPRREAGLLMATRTATATTVNVQRPRFPFRLSRVLFLTIAVIFTILALTPFILTVSGSFKTKSEILDWPPTIIPTVIQWQNYVDVWTNSHFFPQWILNSVWLAVFHLVVYIAIASLVILQFQGSWNEVQWPLVVLRSPDHLTLPLGLASFQGLFGVNWNWVLAGAMFNAVPIILLVIFFQKYFIRSAASSAVKG